MFIYKIKKSMLKKHRIMLDKVMVMVEKAGVEWELWKRQNMYSGYEQ